MSIRKLNKWIKEPKQRPEKKERRSRLRYFMLYTVRPRWVRFAENMRFINRIPRPVMVVLMMLFFFVVFAFNNNIMSERWKNDVISAYPELVTTTIDADGNVQLSPVDRLFVEIVRTYQSLFFVSLFVLLNMIWGDILSSYAPRKPQSIHIKGAVLK